jgi:hypothetical protein
MRYMLKRGGVGLFIRSRDAPDPLTYYLVNIPHYSTSSKDKEIGHSA